jgi:hypothetical protein
LTRLARSLIIEPDMPAPRKKTNTSFFDLHNKGIVSTSKFSNSGGW